MPNEERTRDLLSAVMAVASDLDLPTVLHRIAEAACSLVDARYGALGVLREDGAGLAQFVHVGVDLATAEAIGHLPEGHGILGLLIEDPRPLRLRDLRQHPESYGFPPHHPRMRSFLGVPIRVGDEVYGNLYLAEKRGAEEFSEEDEALVITLAAAAGTAIRNARLYEETRRRERWLDAIREVAGALLEGREMDDVLGLIAARARQLVGGDLATIAVPHGEDGLVLTVTDGVHADRLRRQVFPLDGSVSGEVIGDRRTIVLEDAATDPRVHQPAVRLGDLGPAMFIPLVVRGRGFGTLLVSRLRGAEPFLPRDVELVETLANQATVVLEFGRAQQELRRLAVVEDRERIARDLHDTVIQRLFATGLGLQGVAQVCRDDRPEVHARLMEATESLDRTIDQIRSTIFSLEAAREESLRSRILEAATRVADAMGFAPEVRFRGPIDTALPDEAADHLLATLREALSNAARHSGASRVEVTVEVGDDLVLRVVDDGTGIPEDRPEAGHGLRNMADRAGRLAGKLEIDTAPGKGTTLVWRVPLGT